MKEYKCMDQKSHSSFSHEMFHIHYNKCFFIKGLFHRWPFHELREMVNKNTLALHTQDLVWKSHTQNNTRETKTQRKGVAWDHKTSVGLNSVWLQSHSSFHYPYYNRKNHKEQWTKIKAKLISRSEDCLAHYIYEILIGSSGPQIPNLCSVWCLKSHH